MNKKKISVCVPSFNRPDTLLELINSFLRQDYPEKELVICDDSTTADVENMVKKIKSKEIKFFKNNKSLGFTKNLYKSLTKATGDFLVILGDDDVLLKPETLSQYVNAFQKSDKIYYVYANQVQFSENLDVQCEIKMFDENCHYKASTLTFKKLWLTSIFIGGLGLRNDKKILELFYPKEKILHPQVELVGNILISYDAYTLKDYLIGFRSRESQFIFRALTSKKERQDGSHQNTELFLIFNRLSKKNSLKTSDTFIFNRLLKDSLIIYPKEKMILGNEMLLKNHKSFCQKSSDASSSIILKGILFASLLTPGWLIYIARNFMFFLVNQKNKNALEIHKQELLLAISSVSRK